MRHLDEHLDREQRRVRIAVRHGLHRDHRHPDLLTAWLDGEVISPVYTSPQMKGARLP